MDLLKLFSPAYLFEAIPGSEFASRWLVYATFILLFFAGFAVKKLLKTRPQAKLEHEFFGGIPTRLKEFALVGLLFSFFRDQNVPYLGMRVWILLVVLALLVYCIFIWRNYRKNFAARLIAKQSKKTEDKYLPKAKKRK